MTEQVFIKLHNADGRQIWVNLKYVESFFESVEHPTSPTAKTVIYMTGPPVPEMPNCYWVAETIEEIETLLREVCEDGSVRIAETQASSQEIGSS